MFEISVRDYRGVERADIKLERIALVAGRNEQGKSSLAEAARGVLCGAEIPIRGVLKKDAKALVRDGADKGWAKVEDEGGASVLSWPKAKISGAEGSTAPAATSFAVGFQHLFDLNERDRADALAHYVDSVPTQDDLIQAMRDIGYSYEAAEKVWASIQQEGWDGTHKRTRDHTTRLKGQWEGITREKYGAKKGASWRPEDYPEGSTRDSLEAVAADANEELERRIGNRAVDQNKVNDLRVKAEAIPALEKQEQEAADELQLARSYYQNEIEGEPRPEVPATPTLCPSCNTPLMVDFNSMELVVSDQKAPTKKEIEKAQKARDEYDAALNQAQDAVTAAQNAHAVIENRLQQARDAAARLEEIEASGNEGATDSDVEAARERLSQAQRAVDAFDAEDNAARIHRQIERNDQLAEVLAPDGLRRRKLAAGVEQINDRVRELCAAAGWPAVGLDPDLMPRFGARPLWAASASGRWRARAAMQVTMAMMDGSAAVVLDEADILDSGGRNGMIELLKASGMRALVCMTMNQPTRAPNLNALGIGNTYWIDSGVTYDVLAEES